MLHKKKKYNNNSNYLLTHICNIVFKYIFLLRYFKN